MGDVARAQRVVIAVEAAGELGGRERLRALA
jgi:hypothetical protein